MPISKTSIRKRMYSGHRSRQLLDNLYIIILAGRSSQVTLRPFAIQRPLVREGIGSLFLPLPLQYYIPILDEYLVLGVTFAKIQQYTAKQYSSSRKCSYLATCRVLHSIYLCQRINAYCLRTMYCFVARRILASVSTSSSTIPSAILRLFYAYLQAPYLQAPHLQAPYLQAVLRNPSSQSAV